MAHESFEDADTAEFMNTYFVCIKVDREERPDVDAVYMEATQAMTGQGGWPMTCVLTPTGEPFFCGTYFPPEDRHGMPSFGRVLASIADAWRNRQPDIERAGADVVRQLTERSKPRDTSGGVPPSAGQLDQAAQRLSDDHDDDHGGFGGAPKFPPAMVLEFLLRHAARTADTRSREMVDITCERMARGGMYDQLDGGFARYSVDNRWVVPHFEKMLYDNALLARVYLHWWRLTGNPLGRRIAEETCDWMLADLYTEGGGLAASLDADTDGEEGKFYAWTYDDLGDEQRQLFAVTQEGTFEHGRSVLQLPSEPADPTRYAELRRDLSTRRNQRTRPGRDDKVVTAWNGMAIAALAECGALLDRSDLIQRATGIAEFLTATHLVEGRLRRASRAGTVGDPVGVLDDYGDLAEGLLALHQVTGDLSWLDVASNLVDVAYEHFADGAGGFFDTADDAEVLVRRPQDPTDGATPSGAAAVTNALVTYSALTGDDTARQRAESAIATVTPLIERMPRFAGHWAATAEALVAGPLEIAVVDAPDLASVARRATSPGAVIVTTGDSPLLRDRPGGAAYVCQGFVCDAPTSDSVTLAERIGATA